MNRFKLFITNFLVYGLGGVIGKIIPLVMLPIVTRLMPDTTYFGLNDISTIIVSFGSAIAIMGMYDAMFRMFFDQEDKDYQKSICSSALAFTLSASVITTFILLLFRNTFSRLFFGSVEYVPLLFLSAMSILIGATNSIVSAPTRINNQRKVYLVTNFLSPLISYGISLPLLMKGWYLIALPLASAISAMSMEAIFGYLNHQWFQPRLVKIAYIRQMLKIALPLMPNFLIYWLFSSADRLMIAKMLGNDYAGIYAIGGKIGQVSQLIYTAFAGGWQYFAFSTMKDQDQVEMTSRIFEYLGCIAFIASILMTALCNVVFQLLFTGDYLKGVIVAPYLFLSPLLLMLFQVGCNQFLVIKKTWPNLFILSFGAFLNIFLNFALIPVIGIEGAALATLCGYAAAVIVCVLVLNRLKLLKLSRRFMAVTIIMCSYHLAWRLGFRDNALITALMTTLSCFAIIWLYRRDLQMLFSGLKGKEV